MEEQLQLNAICIFSLVHSSEFHLGEYQHISAAVMKCSEMQPDALLTEAA